MAKKSKPSKPTSSSVSTTELLFTAFLFLVIGIYSWALWFPTRHLPFIGATATGLINGTLALLERQLQPLALIELQTAQTPLMHIVLSQLWQNFGMERIVTHAMILPFLPLAMIALYFVGKKTLGINAGIILAFIFGLTPAVVATYGLVSTELAAVTCIGMALALWLYTHRLLAMFALAVAFLFKDVALVALPFFITWWWITEKDKKATWRTFLPVGGIVLGWYLYHQISTGYWFMAPSVPMVLPPSLITALDYVLFVLKVVLLWQGRWVFTIATTLALLYLGIFKKYHTFQTLYLSSLVTLLVGSIYFGLRGGFEQSMAIILLPFLYLLGIVAISQALKYITKDTDWITVGIGALTAFVFLIYWTPRIEATNEYNFRFPYDLSYRNLITVGRLMGGYLQGSETNSQIYGGLPEAYQLSQTQHGYVSEPLNIDLCDNFSFSPDQRTLVIIHPYHPTQIACNQLTNEYTLVPLQRFEHQGKWAEVFAVTAAEAATKSATPTETEELAE